jgi:hypothetical protein
VGVVKSWKLTLPRRRCPNCGETVWFTFDGVARIHSPQRPGRGAFRKAKFITLPEMIIAENKEKKEARDDRLHAEE